MTVATVTNRATNPSAAVDATNWAAVAGTGGIVNGQRIASAGADGLTGFYRVNWSTGTSALGGGLQYTQTGLSANTAYRTSVWVRSSKAQTVVMKVQWQTSGAANVNSTSSSNVALTANTWTRIDVQSTSGASVDRAVVTVLATTGGSNWAAADQFDGDMIMVNTGTTLLDYFDGSYVSGQGVVYAWTGTANSSTSTATTYTPALALVAKTDAPCDRIEITITDLPPSTNSVTVWRTADGKRQAVRGYRGVDIVGSDFTTDYEAPLNQLISYELEVLAGTGFGGPAAASTITLTPTDVHGWIQDPLDPSTAIKCYATEGPAGEPTLLPSAIAQLEYSADVSIVNILGSNEPVALLGQRMVASNVPFHFFTDAAQQATNLRNMMRQAAIVLIRPGADWGPSLPGLCYVAPPTVQESPVGIVYGNPYEEWKFTSTLVRAPSMNVVIPFWTYGDWQALWSTYQQAQTALSGKTYLQVRKSPATGV